MSEPELHLNDKISQGQRAATRDGFGRGLIEAAKINETVIAICADLTESLRLKDFEQNFPERFVRIGVSEQSLVAIGAGFALGGKVPFVASFAMFSPGRSWEQIRTNVCLNNTNVKIVGGHAGVSVGPDGATHQALEDIAITRCLPNLTVVVPCDAEQARKATLAAAEWPGPVYLRLSRQEEFNVTTEQTPFAIGRAQTFRTGNDVAIVACGPQVLESLRAAENLERAGISCQVINLHTIKPLDEEILLQAAKKCGALVTVEDHQVCGGLGSAVAELLAKHIPTPIEFIGAQDRFGQSGEVNELLKEYGLTSDHIENAVRRTLKRKTEKI
ncbi:transketolase family protein [Patescibacteria group bacterium]|nr:transketolase family protein [Patescibacteria group bacterium]MBU1029151.1 transketolase family protein [Patescibacteria group bacterium]MBU1916026.1 transketolase family protein [Patescibacteria group bacterium]